MTMLSQPNLCAAADRPYLYVTEFLHRVHNEYTCAISLVTRLAARSCNEETKAALVKIVDHLHGVAAVHRLLRPPLMAALVDLSAELTQLCQALTSSALAERGIRLNLEITTPVLLEAKRCWQAELIISEFVTNAARHAFASREGRISIAVKAMAGQVICSVSDDGSPAQNLKRGLGSELNDALAADLDGHVERISKSTGTTVTLFFPQNPDERSAVSTPVVQYGKVD